MRGEKLLSSCTPGVAHCKTIGNTEAICRFFVVWAPKEAIGRIFQTTTEWLEERWGPLLDFRAPTLDKLQQFSTAFANKGCPILNQFGVLDGTLRPTCRPTHFQQQLFNGHRRVHGIKFQSLITPDGIIHSLHGPVAGRRHDAFLLRESLLVENLIAMNNAIAPHQFFVVYADRGYHIRPYIMTPYSGAYVTPAQREFNRVMSSASRICVEWGIWKNRARMGVC
eukprot:Pompholyxophrys_punicea_v1_NODE_54_length_4213_cov_13.619529.p1 type:complete len:224 gc:universal NODE_54_length_4213_cov_13.619529:2087-1416(-)